MAPQARLHGRSWPPGARAGRGPALGRVVALVGVVLLLFWLYLRQAQTIWVTSDGASNALQAWDMLHGNVLLHGWWLSDVSFYTTELPEYALVEAVRGLGAAVIWTSAAITYTLLVVLTGLLAAGPVSQGGPKPAPPSTPPGSAPADDRTSGYAGRGPRSSGPLRGSPEPRLAARSLSLAARAENRLSVSPRLARGVLGAGIVLAPSSVLGTSTLISSPDHTGTAVPLLAIFLLIDRLGPVAERGQRLGRLPMLVALPAATGLLLAWVQVADQVGLFAGALPVAVACGVRFAVRRERLDLALAVAAVASGPAAVAGLRVIRAVGGFTVAPVTSSSYSLFAPLSQLPRHARLLAESVAIMFGANYFGQPSAALRVIAIVHLAGLVVAVLGLAVAGWLAMRRRLDRVSGTLLAAVLIMLAAGLLGTHLGDLLAAREIAVVAPFSAALAGRSLVSLRATGRSPLGATGLCCVLGVGLAAYLGFLCYDGSLARSGPDGQPVADWLVAHRMGDAVAGYWQADVMTLASGGRVTIAPIQLSDASAYHWEARASWFDPARHYARYTISPPSASATPLTSAARPRALFGPPAAVYHVAGYVIQVWDRNLLVDVRHAR